jgi:hypothetical protein
MTHPYAQIQAMEMPNGANPLLNMACEVAEFVQRTNENFIECGVAIGCATFSASVLMGVCLLFETL